MNFFLDPKWPRSPERIDHRQKILSIGSCFTEHIGNALKEMKFTVLQNPNGILFDPASVCHAMVSYIQNRHYTGDELFYLNELWQSWQHHSRFSGTDKDAVLAEINQSVGEAHRFLKQTDWLIITLGSSFSYRLVAEGNRPVANCHRAPGQWFHKHLMGITETIEALDNMLHQLFYFNRSLRVIFTISPVRHIRDGVVENNRSKARLIEAVHHMVNKFNRLYYFPSYEWVIDVLRDYRFYDIDLVHPNFAATQSVLEQFQEMFMSEETIALAAEARRLANARKHRPSHPDTDAHRRFLNAAGEKARQLSQQYPFLDFSEDIRFFEAAQQ
ncbi:MAG TPA: GSCFA domain-containing protein [Chitinophagaceae bacterium]|jgi:hypothetical protein|nr:GSCFA domain-containing protein [Chitinophagaceae bacterium]